MKATTTNTKTLSSLTNAEYASLTKIELIMGLLDDSTTEAKTTTAIDKAIEEATIVTSITPTVKPTAVNTGKTKTINAIASVKCNKEIMHTEHLAHVEALKVEYKNDNVTLNAVLGMVNKDWKKNERALNRVIKRLNTKLELI